MARERKKTETTQTITAGSTLRLETPKGERRRKAESPKIIVAEVNPASGFVGFLRENAIVGLAIGFVVGAQVQVLVKQLITSFIDPLSKLFLGTAISQRTFTWEVNGRSADFAWGAFFYGLLNFLFVLLILYIIIKMLHLDKLDKPKKK